MYKISSLEAGTRFKFYGQVYELGCMDWNTSHPKFPIELLLGSIATAIGLDVVDCYDVEEKRRYWIVVSTKVQVIQPANSNLADVSIKNKIERLERAVAAHNDKIDSLFGHANSLNLAGITTDIVNLKHEVKKIESDKQSFDCVAEIRKLQNTIAEIKSGINANINSDTKIFSEISSRLDKLEGELKDLPLTDYAPGAPEAETDLSKSTKQIGWRKIDPNNLPKGLAIVRYVDNVGNKCADKGYLVQCFGGNIELKGESGGMWWVKPYTHYMLYSELLNLPEIN